MWGRELGCGDVKMICGLWDDIKILYISLSKETATATPISDGMVGYILKEYCEAQGRRLTNDFGVLRG